MVLPIGFFMPLPLAMMIPFMGIQSAVMAKQFGENFQYGKRRISAMSNAEFNKLTPKMLQTHANAELKSMIPSMQDSVIEMREFQTFLVREFLQMINDAIGAGLGKLFGFENPFGPSEFIGGTGGDPSFSTGTVDPSTIGGFSLPEIRAWTDAKLKDMRNRALRGQFQAGAKKLIMDEYARRFDAPPSFETLRATSGQREAEQRQVETNVKINAILTQSRGTTKRKAGQSQILHRNALIKEINDLYIKLKDQQRGFTGGNTTHMRATEAAINAKQIELARFLDKWKW